MQMFPPDTLLMVVRSGILKHTLPLALLTETATINQDIKAISFYIGELSNFVHIYFAALNDYILENYHKDGTTVDSINFEKFKDIAIPLPPLAEQHRIVAAVESAFAIIGEIERQKADLLAAVTTAKQKILSLAIRGKLVPQNPNDKPIHVLTGLTEPSSIPYSLPKYWIWSKISESCEPQETKRPTGDSFRYIDIDSIDNKRHCVAEPKIVSTEQAPSRAAKGVLYGDVLFSMVRPYLENIAFVTEDLSDCIASTGFYVCRPKQKLLFPHYLYYFLISRHAVEGIDAYRRGDNSPAVRKDEMGNFLVPIPPLAEQHRIVVAIEAAFEQLDVIAKQIDEGGGKT
jgi:type I restriction enzyme S subunit